MAEAKSELKLRRERPLSPHLQVYRWPINMTMSILHRVTGAALYFGTIILAWWLTAAAISPQYYDFVNGILGTIPGKLVLFGYTWALLHHMIGGLRHLVWDFGHGFEIASIKRLSWLTIILSLTLTAGIWLSQPKGLGALLK